MKSLLLIALHILMMSSLSAQTDTPQPDGSIPAESVPEDPPTTFTFSLAPSIGLTFQNISKSEDESLTAQWLASLKGRIEWDNSSAGIAGSLYMQFGQLHRELEFPEKTQDNLIVSVTPSITVLPMWEIRLFAEVTGETQMKVGMVDDVESNFIDPLFLYETLFLGQKKTVTAEDESGELSLTYGVGYALQQTVTDKFVLEENREYVIGPNNPLSNVQDQVTLESGLSAIFDLTARKKLGEYLEFNGSIKTVLLGKEETYQDLTKTRIGTLVLASVSYGLLSLEYNLRLLYDSNNSLRRQLEQSLVTGVKLAL